MVHLSARISWHDSGWNGCICSNPRGNASCINHEEIRDARDDEKESINAGIPIDKLQKWLPPCSRDISAYSERLSSRIHSDPLSRKFLSAISEEVPPFSVLPAPYRWMREEFFQEVCQTEELKIRGPENIEKTIGWIYEPDRQRALLDHFWGKVKEGEGKSLIFYYVNEGNPVDENATRLIVGVGRIEKVGQQMFFNGTDTSNELYPIWTRTITQAYPSQGFRLPYQEYLNLGSDPRSFACYVPKDKMLSFSFVGEHVSDDTAIGILEKLIQSVEIIQEEDIVKGEWDRHRAWLNDCLDEVWINRGPYPGIGSVLQYLGFPFGTAFQKSIIGDMVRKNQNPQDYVVAILEEKIVPPNQYIQAFKKAQLSWRGLKRTPNRIELLKLLMRFEFTTEQVKRISDPEERANSGINIAEDKLVNNPYIISELDLGSSTSDPITVNTIDRGMVPEGNSALFISPDSIYQKEDSRRVRAIAVAVLKEAANLGDTIFTITDLLQKVRNYYPDKRACRPDKDFFFGEIDFYQESMWVDLDHDPQLVALHDLRKLEILISETIKRRVKRTNPDPNPSIDWDLALKNKFGEPKNDRETSALEEKRNALQTLFSRRISILTGSAGTGKTSVLKVFIDELEKVEGKQGLFLLAPTGKARVRLSTSTKRNAFTIHQFLLKQQWFIPDIFVLKREGGNETTAPTIIIDECSMVPVDLFGTLLKAINMDMVKRLILVGDPNQLPPIGPGRPFVDLISWMELNCPDSIATLRTSMRISDEDEQTSGISTALSFADGYRSSSTNPGDDELLSLIAQRKVSGDLAVFFWDDQSELKKILEDQFTSFLGITIGDYESFGKSLGITSKPWAQKDWKDAERWQILSPVHAHPYGTDDLNRDIQRTYKVGLIKQAQAPWSKSPRPFGDQQLVYTDKVIQIINRRIPAWPKDVGALDYVANGEIGIVTTTGKNDRGDFLQVGFSTQDGVTYRYSRSMTEDNLQLAYALTVHKSQGSDFDYVFLIIPNEGPTLSRELIYTGLTRFRKKLILLIQHDISTLRELRQPERSDTHKRNTYLFDISLRPDQPGKFYPEALIHRTSTGVAVRSKSEVIVADTFTRMGLKYLYEEPLKNPKDPNDFRLPDFTLGYEGDLYYWEHLGMLKIPSYRESWEKKKKWYEEVLKIPVLSENEDSETTIKPGTSPIVITSRDGENGSIDAQQMESLVKKYILIE